MAKTTILNITSPEVSQTTTQLALAGKIAVVVGGARGVGAAVSLALARAGATVAVTYSASESKAKELIDAHRVCLGKADRETRTCVRSHR